MKLPLSSFHQELLQMLLWLSHFDHTTRATSCVCREGIAPLNILVSALAAIFEIFGDFLVRNRDTFLMLKLVINYGCEGEEIKSFQAQSQDRMCNLQVRIPVQFLNQSRYTGLVGRELLLGPRLI